MGKWEYGGAYRKYNMDGQIKIGTGILKVHNIFDPLPDFMKQADCIFCDPPCSKANINSFYTKADRTDYQESYEPFAKRLFECIDEIKPKNLFLEVFRSNKDLFIDECEKRYSHVFVSKSTYYHQKKNTCWIIHATEGKVIDFEGIDEEDVIEKICKDVEFDCIGDLCMGRGLVAVNAYKNGRRFVGTELNKKRLAVAIDKIKNI